jgi:hypothetical protein
MEDDTMKDGDMIDEEEDELAVPKIPLIDEEDDLLGDGEVDSLDALADEEEDELDVDKFDDENPL